MRIYEQGRSTEGWERGELVKEVSQVNVNDVLIGVSHQFEAENLYRVAEVHDDKFYVVYVAVDGKSPAQYSEVQGLMCVWHFELNWESKEWFFANKLN